MRKSPFLASDILGHWTPQRGEKSMGWVPLCGQASLRRAQPVQSSVAALDDKLAFGLSNWVNCRVIPKWGRPEEELTGVWAVEIKFYFVCKSEVPIEHSRGSVK